MLKAAGRSVDSLPPGSCPSCTKQGMRLTAARSASLHCVLPGAARRARSRRSTRGCADPPAELAAALAAGRLSREILERYLRLSSSMLAPLMRLACAPPCLCRGGSCCAVCGIRVSVLAGPRRHTLLCLATFPGIHGAFISYAGASESACWRTRPSSSRSASRCVCTSPGELAGMSVFLKQGHVQQGGRCLR